MAAAEYYAKKLSKYEGDENRLHNEYICQQAKKYLQKGYSIQETRDAVVFELAAPIDLIGVRAPKRQCTRAEFPSIGLAV